MRFRDLPFAAAVLASAFAAGSQGAALAQTQPAPAPTATVLPPAGTAPAPGQAPPAGTAPAAYPPGYTPPPQGGYAPPPQGYPPGYSPPPQGTPGYPPQQGYYPPQPGYYPPQQGYPPGYYPPQQGYPPGYYPAPGQAPPGYYPPPQQGYPPGYYPAPGQAPPPYYGAPQEYGPRTAPSRPVNVKAVVTGATTLGIAWSISSIAAIVVMEESSGSTGAEPLFVPVVGPFIAIGTMGAFDKDDGAQLGVLLILDGVAQTGALVSIILGATGRDSGGSWASHPAVPEVRVGLGATQLKWQF